MDVHSIESHQSGKLLGEPNVQPANRTQFIFIRAISQTGIWSDRELRFPSQILAQRCVEGLATRRADPV